MDDPTGGGLHDIPSNMWGAVVVIFSTLAGGIGFVFKRFSQAVNATEVQAMIDKSLQPVQAAQEALEDRITRDEAAMARIDDKLDRILDKLYGLAPTKHPDTGIPPEGGQT
jgi:uncharacterized coiled-coil protein SlyX